MDQKERRNYLIKNLIREQDRFRGMGIAQDEADAKLQLRALMNVRMAAPITKEFEEVQDAYLQEVNAGRGIVALSDLQETEPGIIKYPFWQMTARNPQAVYACINYGEAVCPDAIKERAVCIDGDVGTAIAEMKRSWNGSVNIK